MSVAVTSSMALVVDETLETNVALLDPADKKIRHKLSASRTLNATSTPPGTKVVSGEIAMTAGAATLDLRAIAGANGASQDLNGLKVQEIILESKAGNANPITIVGGAANGYLVFGTAGKVTLAAAGDAAHLLFNDSLPDVDATHKTLDISGTGTQTLQYIIVAG